MGSERLEGRGGPGAAVTGIIKGVEKGKGCVSGLKFNSDGDEKGKSLN